MGKRCGRVGALAGERGNRAAHVTETKQRDADLRRWTRRVARACARHGIENRRHGNLTTRRAISRAALNVSPREYGS